VNERSEITGWQGADPLADRLLADASWSEVPS
jgi:hypothetical protein